MDVTGFMSVFDNLPGLYLLLRPDAPHFTIAGANQAYLKATHRELADIIGKSVFVAFPDQETPEGVQELSALRISLSRVMETKQEQYMDPLRYDLESPDEPGRTETRFWRPLNKPVLDEAGNIIYIINAVEDITRQVLAEQQTAALIGSKQSLIDNVLSSVSDGFIALDSNWHYTYANERGAFFLKGSKPADLIGKHIWTLFPEGVGQPFHQTYEKVMKERLPVVMREYYPPWDKWFENRIYPAPDGGITIFFTDITEIKKKELQLKASEDAMRVILDNTEQIFLVIDHNYQMVSFNKAAHAAAGTFLHMPMEKGASILTYYEPLQQENIRLLYGKVFEGETLSYEYTIPESANTTPASFIMKCAPIYDADGSVRNIMINAREITREKEAINNLQLSEERYRMLFHSNPMPLWIFDADTLQFLEVNDAAIQRYGYSRETFLAMTIRDIRPPEDQEKLDALREDTNNEEAPTKGMWRHIRSDGSIINVEITANRIQYQGKKSVLVMVNDVTARIEAERNEANERINKEALINSTDDLIWSVDTSFKLIAANTSFLKSVYRSTGTLVKTGSVLLMRGVFPDAFIDTWEKLYTRALLGESFTEQIHTPDLINTSEEWTEIRFNPIYTEGRITGIACYGRSITERKRAEEKLQKTIKEISDYRFALDQSSIVAITDQRGVIQFVNDNFCKISGYSPEELIGQDHRIINSGHHSKEYLRGLWTTIANGKVWRGELRNKTKKGNYYWVDTTIVPFLNEQGKPYQYVAIRTDITERKNQEILMRDSEEKRRLIMNAALDAIICIDTEGMITFWNPRAELVFGWKQEEVMGKRLSAIIIPEDMRHLHDAGMEQYKTTHNGPALNALLELNALKRDGTVFPVELTVLPIQQETASFFCAFIRDITDRKKAEAEIKNTNERYELVAKATSDAIWDWNMETGEVTRSGDGLSVLFGYDSQEASLDNYFWVKRVHPEDVSKVIENRNRIFLETQDQYWEDEYRFLKANGEYAHVYDRGYIIRNAEGKAIRMIGASQDISAMKRSEQQLQELNTTLEQRAAELAASNTELERFAYVASHDLQEPLRMVSSFLQLLEKQYNEQLDDKAREYIRFAVGGAERMKKLILDLLAYSRTGTEKEVFLPVDMQSVLENTLQIFAPRIEKEAITLWVKPLPRVYGNQMQLQQLMQNLIGNAIKYRKDQPLEITVDCMEEADRYVFAVRDNGIGISQRYFEKIFIVFQRLHPNNQYTGTGIGLAICKKIVERHYGQIWVTSTEGVGSTFYFSLPKTPPEKKA
jgi:two-component system CheB/CheR fusion protein